MKINKENFIEKVKCIHGNKFDYSKAEYNGANKKICIICPTHGEFWQTPNNHLHGQGCPLCSRCKQSSTIEDFIEKAKAVHGNKYDYSEVNYTNNSTKVCIICPVHGEFWMTPNAHLSAKHNCPKCTHQSYKYSLKEFTQQIKAKYPNIDICSTQYCSKNDNGIFICNCIDEDGNKHGFFEKKYIDALRNGCPKCGKYAKLNEKIFAEKANKIHNGKYDYSKVKYVGNEIKVRVICPIHGEFLQTPHSHLRGTGCPLCSKENNINETSLYQYIKSNISIEVIREKKFEWLGRKSLDIFIPQIKVAIEYQGEQHFEPIEFYGGINSYKETAARDVEKYNLCKENGIRLLYFSKAKNIPPLYIDKLYTKEEELLQTIKDIFGSTNLINMQ